MPLLGFFRRKPPVRTASELADFIDEQAAYIVQRYIYDYTNARVGPYTKSLLVRPEFQEAVNRSRWGAYPLGLAMMAEMADGVLRPHAGDNRRAVLDPLARLTLDVFDRYDVPTQIGTGAWRGLREELAQKLDQIGTHPPKPVHDVPEPYVERYFNLMPFDKELLSNDAPTTRAYLRLTLINIRDELVKRMDARTVAGELARQTS